MKNSSEPRRLFRSLVTAFALSALTALPACGFLGGPRINIIFLSEHGEDKYGREAFKLRASGYLLKPYSSDALAEELAHLRYK